jgi:hypothetical protein
METQNTYNQRQRDAFARMLAQAKERAQEEFFDGGDPDREIEEKVVAKLMEDRGALPLVERVRATRKDSEEAEHALTSLGFICTDDTISLAYDAPRNLYNALQTAKRSARRERERSLKKYDLAIVRVWAAENAAEARKIVEELL